MGRLSLLSLFAALPLCVNAADPAPVPEDGSLDCLIEPLRVVQVGSRADGVLEEVLVDRGDTVSRGQLLAELDSLPERAALQLAKQRASENVALRSSQVKFEFGQRRAARFSDSYLGEAATDLEKDEASTAARLARLGVDEARANRLIASLEVARVEALLQQRRITSPLDGVVVERLMNPGERVTDSPILTLAQIDPLKVEVIVPVAMLGSMQLGSRAIVLPEAPVTGEYPATVTVVDRVIDARSGTFGVRLELANPDHALPGGLRCRVRFTADGEQPAGTPVPRAAERTPGTTVLPTPVAPAVQPAPSEPAPADTPRLRSADTGAQTNRADTVYAIKAEHTATVAGKTPPTPVAASADTASTLGNLLLQAAAASDDDGERNEDRRTGEAVVVAVPAAAATDAGAETNRTDTVVAVNIATDARPGDTGVTTKPAAVTPPTPVRDEAAERALLAALPPLPVLGGTLLMDTPAPVGEPATDRTPVPDTQAVAQTEPKAPQVLASATPAVAPDDQDDSVFSRSSRNRAATASGRLRAEQAAAAVASLEPSAPPSRTGCQALGPIDDAELAQRVATRARDAGWSTRLLTREDPSTRKRVLTVALLDGDIDGTGAALAARGFHDLHYLDNGPFAGAWSAGVFSNMEFAEERRDALVAAGFLTDLHPFGRAQKLHWVELNGAALDSDDLRPLGSPASASLDACD